MQRRLVECRNILGALSLNCPRDTKPAPNKICRNEPCEDESKLTLMIPWSRVGMLRTPFICVVKQGINMTRNVSPKVQIVRYIFFKIFRQIHVFYKVYVVHRLFFSCF